MLKGNKKIIVLFLIILLSIGFAYLTSNLEIIGIGHLKKTSWNIYFDNVDIIKGKDLAEVAPSAIGYTTTSINYSVNFNTPGDVYKFNIDVVNDGTVDAMVSLVSKTSLDEENSKFASYSITYEDGSPIQEKNFLGKHSKDTFTIVIEYKKDITKDELLSSEQSINFELGLTYVQAKEADARENKPLIIKDLSDNGNDGKLVGATVNEDGTVTTDGVNDWINCGLDYFNFENSASLVVRFKLNKIQFENCLFGNKEVGGFSIYADLTGRLTADFYTEEKASYTFYESNNIIDENVWYTAVTTYDGSKIKLYLDGEAVPVKNQPTVYEKELTGKIKSVYTPFAIGANPQSSKGHINSSTNATFKSALIFNRALSEEEIYSNYSDVVNPENQKDLLLYYEFK